MKNAIAQRTGTGIQEQAARTLLERFESGKSQKTIEARKNDWKDFAGFMGTDPQNAAEALLTRPLGEANLLADQYKSSMKERGLTSATINRRLSSLRILVSMARTFGFVNWNLEIKNEKRQRSKKMQGPGTEAVAAMVQGLKRKRTPKAIRDLALIRLLWDNALRRAEVVGCNISDLDLKASTLQVLRKGKTEKEQIDLAPQTAKALAAWMRCRKAKNGDDPLFVNFSPSEDGKGRLSSTGLYLIVRSLGEKVSVRTSPHRIRHSSCVEASRLGQKAGLAFEDVRDFSGHSDLGALQFYLDQNKNLQRQYSAMVAAAI